MHIAKAGATLALVLAAVAGIDVVSERQAKSWPPPVQNVSAESPALSVSLRDVVFFQQPRKKGLRQILRVMRTVPFAANEGVERRPVRAAELFECGSRVW